VYNDNSETDISMKQLQKGRTNRLVYNFTLEKWNELSPKYIKMVLTRNRRTYGDHYGH
jgi:hypothetical protein